MSHSLAERVALLPPDQREVALAGQDPDQLWADWGFWARPEQAPPEAWWRWWFLITGRGFGKGRSAAEWTFDHMKRLGRQGAKPRWALVSRSYADVRDVMIEGEAGLAAVADRRGIPLKINRSLPATINVPSLEASMLSYSAEEPSKLRGPNFHGAWIDEPSAWTGRMDPQGENAFTILDMALRLPPDPRGVGTMTPKPVPLVRQFYTDTATPGSGVYITNGSTYDNAANLDPSFLRAMTSRYGGTALAAQEIDGMLIDQVEGALWTLAVIEDNRVANPPPETLEIVVAVDPPIELDSECGIVVCGAARGQRKSTRHAYVLEDASLTGPPERWAAMVVDCATRWNAAAVVAETNQGGEMVRASIQAVDRDLQVHKVKATDGKRTRAEPIALHYDRGRVHHVGFHGALEAQMVTWIPGEGRSPDRVDALVWAIAFLVPDSPIGGPARAILPSRRRLFRSTVPSWT